MPKVTLKKKINKFEGEEVLVRAGWFISLQEMADNFATNPTDTNKHILLGYISSARFIVENLIVKK